MASINIEKLSQKIVDDASKMVIGRIKKNLAEKDKNFRYRASDGLTYEKDEKRITNQVPHYEVIDNGQPPGFWANYDNLRDWVKYSGKVILEKGTEEEIDSTTWAIRELIHKNGIQETRITMRTLKEIEDESST